MKGTLMKQLFLLFLLLFTTDSFSTGISGGTSAPCDNDTLSKYSGTVNAEINWEPNTINLNWYDGGNELNVGAASQTCTYDGTITVPPAPPQKPGYTFNGWKVMGLPAGYTKLEYIESSGTQCIDTGHKFTGNVIKYDLIYNIPNLLPTGASFGVSLFGMSDKNTRWIVQHYWSTNLHNGIYIGTSQMLAQTNDTLNTIYVYSLTVDRINHTYEMVRNGNVVSGNFNGDVTNKTNMMLFAQNLNTYIEQYASYQNYGFKITEDGVLKRNFIPARRNSDNVVGMWDTVTQTFFTNSGSGTFTAGPVVQ